MKSTANTTSHTIKQREEWFEHSIYPNDKKNIQEAGKMRWGKQDPYLFLMILRRNEVPMKFENGYLECLGRRQLRKKMNSHKSSRENWKKFKNCPYFCQTRVFRDWSESPPSCQVKPPKHSKTEFWKKISKCFSRLEGLLARESRAEPRKSLSNPRDWTFHSRTSCQKWPANTRLRPATWLTRDWVAKTGQRWIFEIFKFWEQNTVQKHLKLSKIFLCLN